MERPYSATGAALVAATAAGPLFATALAAALLYAKLPAPIVLSPREVGGLLLFLPVTVPFGFAIAILPILVCTKLMAIWAEHSEFAHEPEIWALAGAGSVAAAVLLTQGGVEGETAFALIVAGAGCAAICWRCYAPSRQAQA